MVKLDRRRLLAASAFGAAWAALPSSAATTRTSSTRPLLTVNPKSQGFDAERLKRIGVAMQRRIDAHEAPGFLTAIMRNGKIVHFETHGYSNIETKTPLTGDAVFRIMSMTKPIVSVAAMILVEENRLRLTDPISTYIPSFAKSQVYVSGEGDSMITAPAKRQIQVRNLLMHTSGLTYGFFGGHPVDKLHTQRMVFPQTHKSLADFAEAAAKMPLMFEPGTQWNYSISTDVLGYIVELVSGQKLGDFLQDRILGPLGMTETGFTLTGNQAERFVTCYKQAPDGKSMVPVPDMSPDSYRNPAAPQSGGGGLVGTADDYLRFASMLLNEGELDGVRILGPQTVKLMRTNLLTDALTEQRDSGFGLGFGIDLHTGARGEYAGEGTFHWTGAYRTHFWIDPTYKIIGLSMTQVDPFNLKFEEDMRALTYQAFLG
jgi:CubicO group peptidase (beta-lactamase class C family)